MLPLASIPFNRYEQPLPVVVMCRLSVLARHQMSHGTIQRWRKRLVVFAFRMNMPWLKHTLLFFVWAWSQLKLSQQELTKCFMLSGGKLLVCQAWITSYWCWPGMQSSALCLLLLSPFHLFSVTSSVSHVWSELFCNGCKREEREH